MKQFHVNGNNNGDYIHIGQSAEQEQNDLVSLEVGHCSTVLMNHQVPVEFITNVLYRELIMKANGDVKEMVENSLYHFEKEFRNERASHVQPHT